MLNKIHDTINSVTLKNKAKIQKKDKNSDAIDTDSDSSHEMADILRPKKKAKRYTYLLSPLAIFIAKRKSMKIKHMKRIRILFDTSCGATMINHSMVTKPKTEAGKALQLE